MSGGRNFFLSFRSVCNGRSGCEGYAGGAQGCCSGGGFERAEQASLDHRPDPIGRELGEALEPVAGLQEAGAHQTQLWTVEARGP